MNNILFFAGRWQDKNGHKMHIKIVNDIEVQVDFYLDEKPVMRKLLGRSELSLNMKGTLLKDLLEIELGEVNIGPTLELRSLTHENTIFLEPHVIMGLYDDYEEDFGVPWVLPLSLYVKVE